jgi:DNA processing protein
MSSTLIPTLQDIGDFDSGAHVLIRAQDESGVTSTIWGWGNPALLNMPCASLVGSRQAEGWGLASLEAVATGLVAHRICVVSGGAVGSDCVAHRAALAAGGCTIVVVPCPIEEINLMSWRREWRIGWEPDRVLFLSPFRHGVRTRRSHPIVRNRLVAALGHGLVAGVTSLSGGTNHTISEAKRLRRPLFVLNTRGTDARLKTAFQTLEKQGCRLFTAEEALAPRFHAEIARAVISENQRLAASEQTQLRFLESPATYQRTPNVP